MTKQHTEPRSRLEMLAAENATLKLQLKQARSQVRLLRAEAAEMAGLVEGAQWRERNWPANLTLQQKLHQVGLLLAQVFTEPEAVPVGEC